MNRIVLIMLLAASTLLPGCKKDDRFTSSLQGSWELRKEQSGMTPTINYSAGNGSRLVFSETNYQTFVNGQLSNSGTYSIVQDPSAESEVCLVIPPGQFKNRIIFDSDTTASKIFIQISNDTLTVLKGCFAVDAGSSKQYVKQPGAF